MEPGLTGPKKQHSIFPTFHFQPSLYNDIVYKSALFYEANFLPIN